MKLKVIPGDGIGQDVIHQAVRIIELINSYRPNLVETEVIELNGDLYRSGGSKIISEQIKRLKFGADAILLGAIGDGELIYTSYEMNVLNGLKTELNTDITVIPIENFSNKIVEKDFKVYIFRENSQGLYAGLGFLINQGTNSETSIQHSIYSYSTIDKYLNYVFDFAEKNGIKSITLADKTGALVYEGNLWRNIYSSISLKHPKIISSISSIDTIVGNLLKKIDNYEIIVCNNLFGDLLTDFAIGLIGGRGVGACVHLSTTSSVIMAEPIHGSAPKYKNKNVVNPIAAINALSLIFHFKGYLEISSSITRAIKETITKKLTTKDLGGDLNTDEVGEAICTELVSTLKQ